MAGHVKIMRVKGDRQAAQTIEKMEKKGYRLENQSTRKAAFSLLTGVFTRKQIHTLTFVK